MRVNRLLCVFLGIVITFVNCMQVQAVETTKKDFVI